MIKRLASCIRQYKKVSVLAPLFIVGEGIMEVIIPILMASLIDNGINDGQGNMGVILSTGLWLVAQHLWMGNVDALALQCTGAALAGLAVGTAAGLAVFRALPLEKIKKLVYAFMLVMGCYILITG